MVSTLRHRGARSAIDLSLRIIVLVCVVATPSLGQEPPPELAVDPQQIDVRTGALRWTGLRLTNSDDGELTWNARVDKPWLKLAAAEARVPVDGLAGVGEILLQLRTIGRGLERGSYEGHVVIDGPDGAVTVPVTMIVGVEPTLDPSETRIESAAVPTRRSSEAEDGYDGIGISIVNARNDGSPIRLHSRPPAPRPGDAFHYSEMIHRLTETYQTRFG